MCELNGKPYVFSWDSKTRDFRGTCVVKFRVCYTLRRTQRWSKPFLTKEGAERHAASVDGFGNLLSRLEAV